MSIDIITMRAGKMKIECNYWNEARQKCTHEKGDGCCTLHEGYCKPSRAMHQIDGDKDKEGEV